jgi:hypothetical protein
MKQQWTGGAVAAHPSPTITIVASSPEEQLWLEWLIRHSPYLSRNESWFSDLPEKSGKDCNTARCFRTCSMNLIALDTALPFRHPLPTSKGPAGNNRASFLASKLLASMAILSRQSRGAQSVPRGPRMIPKFFREMSFWTGFGQTPLM